MFELKTNMRKTPSMSLLEPVIAFHSTYTREASFSGEGECVLSLMPYANIVSGLNQCKTSFTIKYTIF